MGTPPVTTNERLFAMVMFEASLVSNTNGWWLDTGATNHVCADKHIFSSYEKAEEDEKLYMANSASAKIAGRGKVILKFTSGKEVALLNVLHVPEILKKI